MGEPAVNIRDRLDDGGPGTCDTDTLVRLAGVIYEAQELRNADHKRRPKYQQAIDVLRGILRELA